MLKNILQCTRHMPVLFIRYLIHSSFVWLIELFMQQACIGPHICSKQSVGYWDIRIKNKTKRIKNSLDSRNANLLIVVTDFI